jgi:hypothetical protein
MSDAMTLPIESFLESARLTVDAPEDVEAATQYALERGWGDGLPIVPPTPERVQRMLSYWDRPATQSTGVFAPRDAQILPVQVAANSVMAGCRPEYFPLVMLAIEAMCDPAFNLRGVQATTHPVAPLAIFNGPIARELAINSGHNAFGPGHPANATIGRAIRLAMVNIAGATPGGGDMATMGTPAKYSFVVAENEERNPWEPLHVERGFDRDVSTVTVVGCEAPFNINDHFSKNADGLLHMIAGTIASAGANNWYYKSDPVLALGPEHAEALAREGLSKRDIQKAVFERATIPLGAFSPENAEERFRKREPARYANAPLDTPLTIVQDPDDLIVIVLGGLGKHSMYLPTFGATRAVTKALKRADGTFAKTMADLRSGRA